MSVRHAALSIMCAGRNVPVDVYTRKQQKYIRLRISGEGRVRLSAPAGTPLPELRKALQSKQKWLEKHLDRIRSRFDSIDPLTVLLLEGEYLQVEHVPARRKTGALFLHPKEGRAELRGPELSRQEWLQVIARGLRKEAEHRLPKLAQQLSRETGISYQRLYLRNQRTRWGSSSSLGNISLNWRSVMLPGQVQRYLILHELVHQHHLNHSPQFWSTLSAYCPQLEQAERWLKANSALISLFRE